jgi:hypothetical protein
MRISTFPFAFSAFDERLPLLLTLLVLQELLDLRAKQPSTI